MTRKRSAGVIVLTLALGATSTLFAVCAQNSDVINLTRNGKKITSSDYVLASKNPNGGYTLASYCIEGTCFSRYFGGDVSNVYFVQISDETLLKQMKSVISDMEKSVLAGNKGLESDRYRGTRNLYVSDGLCAHSPFNKVIAGKIDGLKKYPFIKINSVKNHFSFDFCGYQRVITYDLKTNQISVQENGKNPAVEIKRPPPCNSNGSPQPETE